MAEPTTPHLGDELVDLALGHVDGQRRAAMTAHLLECPDCRREYDELSAGVNDLVTAAPGVQPPLGFDEQVLARLVGRRPSPTVTRPRRWWLAAAAVAALVTAGVLGVLAGRLGDGDAAETAVAPIRATSDGRTVGTASVSEVEGAPVLVVALVDAPAGVSYSCRMRLRDGTTVTTDPWPAVARGAWVVDVPGGDADQLERIELVVTDTDNVWSTATL